MLDSAAIGAIIGAVARAAPELLKFIDRHLDRRHELAMQDRAIEYAKLPGAKAKALDSVDAGQLQQVFDLMREAYAQQFNSGNPILNAISVLVRPLTTGVLVALYVFVKVVMIVAALRSFSPVDSLIRVWDPNDWMVLTGILTFWFLDRGLFRQGGK